MKPRPKVEFTSAAMTKTVTAAKLHAHQVAAARVRLPQPLFDFLDRVRLGVRKMLWQELYIVNPKVIGQKLRKLPLLQ